MNEEQFDHLSPDDVSGLSPMRGITLEANLKEVFKE